MVNDIFRVSFFCNYPDGGISKHTQDLMLSEIGRWVDSYKFTHPNCNSISIKVWFNNREEDTV